MAARFYVNQPLASGASLSLPEAAARHVQVLRMQPGESIMLFNGQGDGGPGSEGEFQATIERMGRSDVDVTVGPFGATRRELPRAIHIAVGMPANERMDWLVEKASELGVTSIRPLMAERSVLRLKGDRSDKKIAHWRGIAVAACEQCGRNRVPVVHDALSVMQWLKSLAMAADKGTSHRLLLSLRDGSQSLAEFAVTTPATELTFLSGPEGGLSPAEEDAAFACGFRPITLGPRVLRAETAPLAVLALLGLQAN